MTFVRNLLVVRQWTLFKVDVKNIFLNGDLIKKVYMKPLLKYSHPLYKVYKLHQVIYGLKQALDVWFAKFGSMIQNFSFHSRPHDSAIFLRCTDYGCILLLLYVDDMIIIGDDLAGISNP